MMGGGLIKGMNEKENEGELVGLHMVEEGKWKKEEGRSDGDRDVGSVKGEGGGLKVIDCRKIDEN